MYLRTRTIELPCAITSLLRAAPLDLNQALGWGIQFCLGMEHAQGHGLECHRDIKPTNILIGPNWTLKIADFGLASAALSALTHGSSQNRSFLTEVKDWLGFSLIQTKGRIICGTPGYFAPELHTGRPANI